MTNTELIYALTFTLYLGVVMTIGWVAYQRTASVSDYLLGGRRLGRWATALSASASDMSGWLLLGLPGFAYAAGFPAAWMALGLWIGTYLNWRLVAPRLRTATEHYGNAITLPEYFENRFDDRTHGLRVLSAFFILLFFLFYTSSGLVAGGKLFEAVFGLPYFWAVTSGGIIVLAYTALGGFLAVVWTDIIQGLLMAAALVAVPLVATAGNKVLAVAYHFVSDDPAFTDPFVAMDGTRLSAIAIVSLLGWGLGYFGQPHILARFKAIRSADLLPSARRIAVTWTFITLLGALTVGFVGIFFIGEPLNDKDVEKVFLLLVQQLFHPIPAALCLAAILAAIMSTADSQLLVASSAATRDLYKLLPSGARRSDAELVRAGRGVVVVIAVIAWALALDPDSQVLTLVSYAWAGFGAAFGPAVLLSLYWPGMTGAGALAGILTGGLTVVAWKPVLSVAAPSSAWIELYALIPGFGAAAAAIVVVSLLTAVPQSGPPAPA